MSNECVHAPEKDSLSSGMSARTRIILGAVVIAIYVLMLLLLPLPADALGFHNARKEYVRQVYRDLEKYALILGEYEAHPPTDSTSQEDVMYVTRGECDISIVEERLARYARRDVDKAVIEEALKQLARDIEDTPVWDEHNRRKI